jgi:glycosyltransferase involved in cell wall biosynthesis
MRMTDRLVDAVFVNCEAMRRHLIEDELVPPGRIRLCYNGVDTSQFHPLRPPGPGLLPGASIVVGVVCALRPEKALHVLQEAFSRVCHLRPEMKLVIVGSGPELGGLQANAARLGIDRASVFVPSTPHVVQWLRSIDIFVLPSMSEAFSNSLLEAMACGCAAIGSRVGGTPELIGDDERGLLFRPGDAADLAGKLSTLVGNENLRRELGARAAQFVGERLTIEIAVRRTAEIYEQLLRWKCGGPLN